MIQTILTSVFAFAGTNIDDLFVLTLFFAQTTCRKQDRAVLFGQYCGIGLLVLFSILCSLGLQFFPPDVLRFLGLLPIGLGIKAWLERNKETDADAADPTLPTGKLSLRVALISIANGADNLGVYIPLFSGYTARELCIAVLCFALLVAVWCLLAGKLASLPALRRFLTRYKKVLIPVIFILLGIGILLGL